MLSINNPLDDPKQMFDFMSNMYEFAAWMQNNMIDTTSPTFTDPKLYAFMTYIEDIMDLYGRGLLAHSAAAAGLDEKEALTESHAAIDSLRETMNSLKGSPVNIAAVDEAAKRIKNNWGTRE
jgi:hypothetical protein